MSFRFLKVQELEALSELPRLRVKKEAPFCRTWRLVWLPDMILSKEKLVGTTYCCRMTPKSDCIMLSLV